MKYLIKKEQAGIRLDKFLVEKLKIKTRGEIQKLIEANLVLINDTKKSNHYALKEGETVEVKRVVKKKAEKFDEDYFKKIEVISETNDYLVLNKPAGLIVHGAPYIKEPTLADWLLKKYPRVKNVGEDRSRPGIMHRLDKEASGLLVIAKTNEMFFNLKKQFQDRKVEKKYEALVYGNVSKEGDKIDFRIKRATAGFRQAAVPDDYVDEAGDLREAYTEFKVKKRFVNYTLLDVKIKSGRKHQIRVHFYAYGHALVGDNIYSTRTTKSLNKKLKLGRIFLVSTKLSFVDLAGKKQTFSVPLPDELKNFLKTLT